MNDKEETLLRQLDQEIEELKTKLSEKEREAKEYRKLLLEMQAQGGTHNFKKEIDKAVSKYGDSGLNQQEEY